MAVSSQHLELGTWKCGFHDCVGIRKALKAVSQVRDGRVEGHREVPPATPTMQAVQDSWMGLVTQIIRRLIPPPVIVIAGVLPLMIYCNDLGFRV
jgi:hypothetical protein